MRHEVARINVTVKDADADGNVTLEVEDHNLIGRASGLGTLTGRKTYSMMVGDSVSVTIETDSESVAAMALREVAAR